MSKPKGFFSPAALTMAEPEQSLIPKCGACGLFKDCESPKMPPSGKGKRRVLIVAEAPGREEDREGVQLVGKAGNFLEQTLRSLGINMREDCWLTNALICHPKDNKIKDKKAVGYCRPNLLKTISKLKPDVIIPLGRAAVQSIAAHAYGGEIGAIERWVGWQCPSIRLNAYVCPTWHPSYLLREESKILEGFFTRHLKEAFDLKGKPYKKVPNYKEQITLEYDAANAAAWLDTITSGVIAFDYECNMLKPESDKAKIVCASVCWNGERTLAFPWHGKAIKAMKRLLGDKSVFKTAQNMKYEDRWTRAILGVEVRGWRWDTLVGSHLLDCRQDISSLKFMAFTYLGQPRYDKHIEPFLKSEGMDQLGNAENKIHLIPLKQLLIYSGLDSLLQYLIAEKQTVKMGTSLIPPNGV